MSRPPRLPRSQSSAAVAPRQRGNFRRGTKQAVFARRGASTWQGTSTRQPRAGTVEGRRRPVNAGRLASGVNRILTKLALNAVVSHGNLFFFPFGGGFGRDAAQIGAALSESPEDERRRLVALQRYQIL